MNNTRYYSTPLLTIAEKYMNRRIDTNRALLKFAVEKDFIYNSGYLLPRLYPQDDLKIKAFYIFHQYQVLFENSIERDPDFFFRQVMHQRNRNSIRTLHTLNGIGDRYIPLFNQVIHGKLGYEDFDYTVIERRLQHLYDEHSL